MLKTHSYDRKPAVAGYFYPSKPVELRETISQLFQHSLGPGKEPVVAERFIEDIVGYIAPHAGYMYSGPVASHVYYDLASRGRFDTAIIIGTNHTGLGSLISVYPGGEWITPLGRVKVDSELAKRVVDYSELAELDTDAHIEEHSVEVQIPFLQYLYGENFTILPIVIGLHTVEASRDLAKAIRRAVDETGRRIVLIASSDFNHYEPYDITKEKDMLAIRRILELDSEAFYRTMIDNNISICGPGGIMTLIEYAKISYPVEELEAVLLKYANSGDVSGDRGYVVGYAGLRIGRGRGHSRKQ